MADTSTLTHQCESLPQCDEFQPKDHGEAHRYLIVREAVLTHLLEEPDVKALFAKCDKKTKLSKLAKAFATANDQQRDAAWRQFIDSILSLPRTIGPEIIQAVEKWGLPWIWVDRWLLHAFVLQHGGTATGTPFRTRSEIQKDDLDINLKIRSGTSKQELDTALDRIRHAYETNLLPPGRVPMTKHKNAEPDAKKGAYLDRNAYWYVRHKIGGVPPLDLAKLSFGNDFQRLTRPDTSVSKGIKAVERLLSLTSYTRRPDPRK